ncbi:MAG TPA: hypothetical protein VJ842_07555 [Pyrinomonadaceae bacterium]|nr:hypothetical protein [Pyrinomonadaceae bacterium]
MDNKTLEMLEELKQYLDEVEPNHQGWENASRVFMMAYGKLVELSAYLAPKMGADRVTKAHLEITMALRGLSDIIKETEDED